MNNLDSYIAIEIHLKGSIDQALLTAADQLAKFEARYLRMTRHRTTLSGTSHLY